MEKTELKSLGDSSPRATRHLYDVEVAPSQYVEVYANTRAQANKIACQHGYEVRSVNMVG
jgi:hypothetical protein